ncbi:amino acid adenylation domain-containing protein [Streptomyces sp. TX20-6-3]|uniref:non-ribosomal peptide synthetase n=1 Tax=Streptomyces sp. TX20-6-3 TaxID=3028705 RepID=UPI0029A0A709|nr:amino acid adenylation domain-containing protein [Streptomyces sp. TX20-6-3]MDX2565286.1 amino acid adenylation domain-containing protein [Streptomyces sp. TX20-6-3]
MDSDEHSRPNIGEPFPLTPMQQAYWVGRRSDQPLGGVGCQGYFEFDGVDINVPQLLSAAERLVQRHSMLRARFLPSCQQQIYEHSLWEGVSVHDLRTTEDAEIPLLRLRERMSRRCMDAESGPLFDIQLSLLPERHFRLHIQADLLVADSHSVKILLADLLNLYQTPAGAEPTTKQDYSFADFLRESRVSRAGQRAEAEEYWRDEVKHLPGPPALPLLATPEAVGTPTFAQREHRFNASMWQQLQEKARAHGVTPAMALTTAYGEVVGRWSTEKRFLLNLPVLGRWDPDPRIQGMVGDFSNMVLLPMDVTSDLSFADRARRVQSKFRRNLMKSRHYFGVEVLREITRIHPGQPANAPVVFTYHITDGDFVSDEFCHVLGEPTYIATQTPQVWIDHQVLQLGGELVLKWDSVDELFPRDMIDDMFRAYVALVDNLASRTTAWQSSVKVRVPESQAKSRAERNSTNVPVSRTSLHERFFSLAAAKPNRTALFFRGQQVSYGQLAASSLRVAACLRGSGIKTGERVAVCLPRGIEQITSLLGILASGAAYVPIDPTHPAGRRERIIQGAAVKLAITQDIHWSSDVQVVPYHHAASTAPLPAALLADPDLPAYIISTSGSTGEPKHVQVSHRAAVNTIQAINDRYDIRRPDCTIGLSNYTFDLSVYDIFGPLSAGGSLLILGEEERNDPETWAKSVSRYGVTLWQGVPATLEMLLDSLDDQPFPTSLRLALLSGDWINTDLPRRLDEASAGKCLMVALGGPTETVIWSNIYDVDGLPPGWRSVPYGHPLRNQQHRVVDETGQDCCDWVPGELWIGSSCLADGYAGNPGLTAERFIELDGQRWYRTGDLVRYRPGGTLEILGRTDHQVKLNGHRVELGEIEAVLQSHDQVAVAVAVISKNGPVSRIAAFVTPREELVDMAELAARALQFLPVYARPTSYFVIDALPRTPNDKIDRLTLSAWASSSPMHHFSEPPQPGWEAYIAGEWERVLGHPVRGRDDDFYSLGGDSILATRLAQTIRAQPGAEIPLRTFFAASTVRAMASLLSHLPLPQPE